VQPAFGVEHIGQPEQVAFIGSAAVMEDQEALGFSPGGAFLVNKSSQRSLR
jgi:hypothetical protein